MTREEAIQLLCVEKSIIIEVDGNKGAEKMLQAYDMAIEALSADTVHGKWIPIEETLPTYDGGEKTWLTGMKCSNCGKLFDLRVGYHYCPSCGARMYKGGDSE